MDLFLQRTDHLSVVDPPLRLAMLHPLGQANASAFDHRERLRLIPRPDVVDRLLGVLDLLRPVLVVVVPDLHGAGYLTFSPEQHWQFTVHRVLPFHRT